LALVEAASCRFLSICGWKPQLQDAFSAIQNSTRIKKSEIQFIANRQEGGAPFMAEAHSKLNRTNASIGVHTAFQDSKHADGAICG